MPLVDSPVQDHIMLRRNVQVAFVDVEKLSAALNKLSELDKPNP